MDIHKLWTTEEKKELCDLLGMTVGSEWIPTKEEQDND